MSNTTNFKKSLLATASLAALSVTSFKAVGAPTDISSGETKHSSSDTDTANYDFSGDGTLTIVGPGNNNIDKITGSGSDNQGTVNVDSQLSQDYSVNKVGSSSGNAKTIGALNVKNDHKFTVKTEVNVQDVTIKGDSKLMLDYAVGSSDITNSVNADATGNGTLILGDHDSLDIGANIGKGTKLGKIQFNQTSSNTGTLSGEVHANTLEFTGKGKAALRGTGSTIGDIVPHSSGQNELDIGNDVEITGALEDSNGNSLKAVNFTADKTLTLTNDSGSERVYNNNFTANSNQGTLSLGGADKHVFKGQIGGSSYIIQAINLSQNNEVVFDNSDDSSEVQHYINNIDANSAGESIVTIKSGKNNTTLNGSGNIGTNTRFGEVAIDIQNDSTAHITGSVQTDNLHILANGNVKLGGSSSDISKVTPENDGVNKLEIAGDTIISGELDNTSGDSRVALKEVQVNDGKTLTLNHTGTNSVQVSTPFTAGTADKGIIDVNGKYDFAEMLGTSSNKLNKLKLNNNDEDTVTLHKAANLASGAEFTTANPKLVVKDDINANSGSPAINFNSSDGTVVIDGENLTLTGSIDTGANVGTINVHTNDTTHKVTKGIGATSTSNAKLISVSGNGTFDVAGSVYSDDVQFENNGTIKLQSDSTNISKFTTVNEGQGNVILTAGSPATVNQVGSSENPLNSIRIDNGNSLKLKLDSAMSVNKVFTTNNKSTVTLDSGGTFEGNIVKSDGGVTFSNVTVLGSNQTLGSTSNGGGKIVAKTLTAAGAQTLTANDLVDVDTIDFNSNGATLDFYAKNQPIRQIKNNLSDNGTITLQNGGSIEQTLASDSAKLSDVNLNGGHYSLAGDIHVNGSVTLDQNSSLEISDDVTVNTATGSLVLGEKLDLGKNTLTLKGGNNATTANSALKLKTTLKQESDGSNSAGNISADNSETVDHSGDVLLKVRLDTDVSLGGNEVTIASGASGSGLGANAKFAKSNAKTWEKSRMKKLEILSDSNNNSDKIIIKGSVESLDKALGDKSAQLSKDLKSYDQFKTLLSSTDKTGEAAKFVNHFQDLKTSEKISKDMKKQSNSNNFLSTVKEGAFAAAEQVSGRAESLATGVAAGANEVDVSSWIQANGNYISKAASNDSDYDHTTAGGGGVIGIEANYASNSFGLAGIYHYNTTGFENSEDKKDDHTSVHAVGANAYGVHHLSNFSLNEYVGGLHNRLSWEASRAGGKNKVDNKSVNAANGGFSLAYNYRVNESIIISPVVGFDGNYVFGTEIGETDVDNGDSGFANNYSNLNSKSAIIKGGIRTSGDFDVGANNFAPFAKVGVKYDITANDSADFNPVNTTNMQVEESENNLYVEGEGGLDAKIDDNFEINSSIKYTTDLFDKYHAVRGSIKVKYTF